MRFSAPTSEYGLVVLAGAVSIDDQVVEPGKFAYLGSGRDECRLASLEPSRALLIGGVPFEESILMWWNFLARTRQEIVDACKDWSEDDARFGTVDSSLDRI